MIDEINKEKKETEEDLLNVTADFPYHPYNKSSKAKNDAANQPYTNSNNKSSMKIKPVKDKETGQDYVQEDRDSSRAAGHPYGPKLRIRSSSNTSKYQMYDPKNMPYKK